MVIEKVGKVEILLYFPPKGNGNAEVPCESDLSLAYTLDVSDGCDITILRNPDDYSQSCYVKLSGNGQSFQLDHTSFSHDVR